MTDNVLLAGYTCVLSLYLGKILMRSFFGQVKDVPKPSPSQESKGSPLFQALRYWEDWEDAKRKRHAES